MYNKKCQQTKCLRVCGCVVIEENEKKAQKNTIKSVSLSGLSGRLDKSEKPE